MLVVGATLKGYAIEATDGPIGTVKSFLFDDTNWKVRWLVVKTGSWLSGREVLVHPSAIGTPDHDQRQLPVKLTRAKVKASPDIAEDLPVTRQMQSDIYDYYGWDPYWGPNYYGVGSFGLGAGSTFMPGQDHPRDSAVMEAEDMGRFAGDQHLRDMNAVTGYHVHATDGGIGHVENFLLDDATWAIAYLIVDTSNWWIGAHVLISPFAVKNIDWTDKQVHLNATRAQVKTSPKWDKETPVPSDYTAKLHTHYGWPGLGW
jgi:hypothetical protein